MASIAGMPMNHRNDIEGLRAVAVTSVLCYRGNSASLPGGFVSVDIFWSFPGF
jgi:peptidoglycan/LPS O-acetylase OafA/YrhL